MKNWLGKRQVGDAVRSIRLMIGTANAWYLGRRRLRRQASKHLLPSILTVCQTYLRFIIQAIIIPTVIDIRLKLS